MKVTLLSTFDTFGGAGVAASRLLKALSTQSVEATMLVHQQTGHQVCVKAVGNQKVAFARFAAERALFWPHERSKQVRFAFSPARVGVDISQHPAVREADVLHLHWINFGFLSLSDLEKLIGLGKPIIWTLHDMWTFTGGCHYAGSCLGYRVCCGNCPLLKRPAPHDLSHQVWLKKKAILTSANITYVTCSEWLASLAQLSGLLRGKEVLSIPNPIDNQLFKPTDKNLAKKALGLPPDKQYLLFAAQNVQDERKGFRYFKEAIQQSSLPDSVEILTFGKNQHQDFEGFPIKIHHLGSLSNVDTIVQAYQAASVFVIPSLEDNLPNTVMESLACGTPVVAFQTGGIPEMVQHLHNGFIAAQRSAQELAQGIEWVLTKADYEQVSNFAVQTVNQNFAETIVAQRYRQLYDAK
ncbi:MAG: glycosyltransferase family 4 protein [Spirosomataceae bacterium]